MNPRLRRGVAVSVGLHILVVLALIVTIPRAVPPPEPTGDEVAMVFEGPAPAARGERPAPTPAQKKAPTPLPVPPAVVPPTPDLPEPPPPAPPPPPPPTPSPSVATPTPPAKLPPLPPLLSPTPTPAPPPPASPPTPPVPQPKLPTPPVPVPPPPVPQPTVPAQHSQPNPTKNVAPDSRELNATLEKLRSLQKQTKPPTRHANPLQGGAPVAGGTPQGDDTSKLSQSQARAIGNSMRRCWTYDPGAKGVDQMQALLTVETDGDGVVHVAQIAPQDQGRLSDPVFRAFAERAVRTVLSPICAKLPLPPAMLGQRQTLTFRFSP